MRKRPFFARDQTAHSPSGPVTVPLTKVAFALSGRAQVQSRSSEVHLSEGSILTIPPGLECRGYPVGHIRTVTLYIHPEYLNDQMKWLPIAHPLVHHLHRAMAERHALQQLQLKPSTVQQLTPQLARLARPSSGVSSDFTLLSLASEAPPAPLRQIGG